MVPFLVILSVISGSVARAVWGWLDSGENFSKRKFAATMIFTIFAVALPVGVSMFSSAIIVSTGGLIGICVSALIAGWGADSGLKEISKLKNTTVGGRNVSPTP